MIFHPSQSKVAKSTKRFRVVCAGRRVGKTVLAINEMAGKAYSRKGMNVAYIAPTYQQARDIAWVQLVELVKPIAVKINETRLEITVQTADKGKSMISLRGWESVETLRGQAFDFIVLDEIASMRNWDVSWSNVIRPTLTDREGSVLFISTPKGFNHFYDLYNLYKDPVKGRDYESFHFTSYDNPYVKKSEIEDAKRELEEDQFAQEYLADFRKTQGLVYKGFDRVRHVYNDASFNIVDRLVPIDWGWTNPATVYLILKDSDANYWVTNEFYKTGKTTDEIIEIAKSYRGTKYYPDPAEPDRIDQMRRMGLNVREVSKDIEAGIRSVQELLKTNRLHIHFSCTNLINEFETYRYPDKKPDHNETELPIKENDHALDAIRYALYMQESFAGRSKAKQFIPSGMSANRGYKAQIK